MRLLLVEDDELLGSALVAGLKQSKYAVDWVKDGDEVESYLNASDYNVMILDIGLPKRSGLEVLKALRRKDDDLPVLILTAQDAIADKVRCLDSGADDYLIKPFDLDELNARIRALLRRQGGRASAVIQYVDITLDPAAHSVKKNDVLVEVSPHEYALLYLLLENQGRVMSRSQLEQGVYSWDDDVSSNIIEVHIHHLRKKLGAALIKTIRGIGYIIEKHT